MGKIIGESITFDDVLLVPSYSEVIPNEVDLSTNLTTSLSIFKITCLNNRIPASNGTKLSLSYRTLTYIIPPIPPPAGIAGASSLMFATTDSVVRSVDATLVAFSFVWKTLLQLQGRLWKKELSEVVSSI